MLADGRQEAPDDLVGHLFRCLEQREVDHRLGEPVLPGAAPPGGLVDAAHGDAGVSEQDPQLHAGVAVVIAVFVQFPAVGLAVLVVGERPVAGQGFGDLQQQRPLLGRVQRRRPDVPARRPSPASADRRSVIGVDGVLQVGQ